MKAETFAVPDNGDVDKGWAILSSCWALVAVAFVSTITRIWIRARLTRNLSWDDFFISLAMVNCPFSTLLRVELLAHQLIS